MWGQGAGRHRLAGSYLPLQPESGGLSGCGKQGELGNSLAPNQLHEEQVGSAPGSQHFPAAWRAQQQLQLPERATRGAPGPAPAGLWDLPGWRPQKP